MDYFDGIVESANDILFKTFETKGSYFVNNKMIQVSGIFNDPTIRIDPKSFHLSTFSQSETYIMRKIEGLIIEAGNFLEVKGIRYLITDIIPKKHSEIELVLERNYANDLCE